MLHTKILTFLLKIFRKKRCTKQKPTRTSHFTYKSLTYISYVLEKSYRFCEQSSMAGACENNNKVTIDLHLNIFDKLGYELI